MDLSVQKTNIVFFTCKTSSIHFNYHIGDVLILCTNCVKNLSVMLDSKLYFHHHDSYVSFQALKLLEVICFISDNFSFLDSVTGLYVALIQSKLECASVSWDNRTLAGLNKLENIQKKFANLC
jgi:hypothetical protein